MSDEPITLDVNVPMDESDFADDFTIWISVDDSYTTSFRGKATWRLGLLGKMPHIATKFNIGGVTYQMRLMPTRQACGPANIILDRELKKQALLDAKKYGSWEPEELTKYGDKEDRNVGKTGGTGGTETPGTGTGTPTDQ